MARLSKKLKLAREKVDSNSVYSLSDASSLVREISSTNFDPSVAWIQILYDWYNGGYRSRTNEKITKTPKI